MQGEVSLGDTCSGMEWGENCKAGKTLLVLVYTGLLRLTECERVSALIIQRVCV